MNQNLNDAIEKAQNLVGIYQGTIDDDNFLASLINALSRDILCCRHIERTRRAETAMHILPSLIGNIPQTNQTKLGAIIRALEYADELWKQALPNEENKA